MFKKLFVIALMFGFTTNLTLAFAEESALLTIQLNECTDKNLQIQFLCNPDWELQTDQNVIFIIMSTNPYVSMTIARSDTHVYAIEQLNKDMVKEIGQYRPGFTIEKVQVDGKSALKVDGTAINSVDTGLRDYYLIYNDYLYSVLFAIQPNYYLIDYEKVIEEIVKSIRLKQI